MYMCMYEAPCACECVIIILMTILCCQTSLNNEFATVHVITNNRLSFQCLYITIYIYIYIYI